MRHLPSLRLALTALLISGAVAACGGGPRVEANSVSTSELSVTFGSLSGDWKRLDAEGPLVSYRHTSAKATLALSGRCGKDGDDVPLEALTDHLFLQFEKRELIHQEELKLDGRAALRTQMRAELDGVVHTFDIVVLKKNGCVYDFLLIGPTPMPPAVTEEFQAFFEGFRTQRP